PPYTVFPNKAKILIVALVSIAGFFSPLAINIYIPALPEISKELGISNSKAMLSVTSFMIFQGISPSFWATAAESYGRRPVYIATFLVFIIANILLAVTDTFTSLILLRCLQAAGSSTVISIGAGTIKDIATADVLGSYIGWYGIGKTMGPCIGPVVGGILAAQWGYRSIFWFLTVTSALFMVVMTLTLPETLRSMVGNGSIPAKGIWAPMVNLYPVPKDIAPDYHSLAPKKERMDFLEPLKMLFKKDIFILVATNGVVYGAYYTVSTSAPDTFRTLYGLSQMQIGLTFIPSGVGAAIGSVIAGNLLDREYLLFVRRDPDAFPQLQPTPGRKRRVVFPPEFPLEQARLRAIFPYYGIYVATMVAYGWCLQAQVSLAVLLFLQFLLAFAATSIYVPLNTLSIDLYPSQAATVAA
ncbi:major facilitator superfamily domain-containing protein, partial [Blyttiomyces helicus]